MNTEQERIWYEWGRRDWRDLGRYCGSIQRNEVRKSLADAYKAGFQSALSEGVKTR